MKALVPIKKRIFYGLVILCFFAILSFSFAIKFSTQYLENVILTSNYEDELDAISKNIKQGKTWLPQSTHTFGFLASNTDVPAEFMKYDVGQHHDIIWNSEHYHLFVTPISSTVLKNDMLYIAIQIEAIERYEEQLNFILFIVVLSLGIASLWLAFWFTSLISTPITELSDNVRNLQAGDTKLATHTRDSDLAPIENAINSYLLKINEHLKKEKIFFGIASHELRTPISTIRSSLETFIADLPNNPLNEKQSSRILRIQRASIEMQYITESLLYFVKQNLEDTHQENAYQLSALIQEIIDEHQILKRNSSIKIIMNIDSDFQSNIKRELMKIIIGNLLRNSLENTFSGSITIKLNNNLISIEDSGKGTPKEIQTYLHQKPFEGLPHKQVGIGLYLVAKLCDQLHIDLQISDSRTYASGTLINLHL